MAEQGSLLWSGSGASVVIASSRVSLNDDDESAAIEIPSGGNLTLWNSTIECPPGAYISVSQPVSDPFPVQDLAFSVLTRQARRVMIRCQRCGDRTYRMNGDVMVSSTQTFQLEGSCKYCPIGANCSGLGSRRAGNVVRARAGFWGQLQNGSISMMLCPGGYCWEDLGDSAESYDWCMGNRSKTSCLCADCLPGYTEALFTTACTETTRCSAAAWFIPVIVLVVSPAISLFLLITPQLGAAEGYLKILLFFLQTLPFLKLVGDGQVGRVDLTASGVMGQALNALNFRDAAGSAASAVCLWVGMTAIQKEAIQFSIPALVTVWMAVFYLVSFLRPTRSFVGKRLPAGHVLTGFQIWLAGLPSKRDMFWAGAIQTVLLVYNSVLTTALTLLTCVATADRSTVLAIHGTTPCLTPRQSPWWQWFLLALIVVGLSPIPLWLALLKRWKSWQSRASSIVMLESPYRHAMRDWESIVLIWRFLVVVTSSVVMDPSRRLLLLSILFVVILFVHMLAHPYKTKRAQNAAAVSFVILIVLAVSNSRYAVSLVDLNDDDRFESVVRGFRFAFLFFPMITLAILELWKHRARLAVRAEHLRKSLHDHVELSDRFGASEDGRKGGRGEGESDSEELVLSGGVRTPR